MAFSCKQLIFVGLVVALAMAYQARTATALQVRLLSENTGRFVSVASGGVVTAQAQRSDPTSRFYYTSPAFGVFRFESVSSPGSYLIIENNMLKAGTPSGGNDEFQLVTAVLNSGIFLQGLSNSPGCFIAFEEDGQAFGPCGLSLENDPETEVAVLFA